MPFKYKLPSGQIIEADTAKEIQELILLFENNEPLVSQNSSVGITNDFGLNKTSETSTTLNDQNTFIKPPSETDFIHLWNKLETEKAKKVMQLFAQYAKQGLTSKQLAQHLGVERASGIMSSINKRSEEIGFSWKHWFRLNSGVYEANDTAYVNLVEAIRLVNTQ